jgi:hypothetical protein
MGSEQYIKEAISNINTWLEKCGLKLKSRAPSVLPTGYRPELDTTRPCNKEEVEFDSGETEAYNANIQSWILPDLATKKTPPPTTWDTLESFDGRLSWVESTSVQRCQ